MLKDMCRLTKLFLKLYWVQSLMWILLQVVVISIYRKLTVVTFIGEPIAQTPSNAVMFILAGTISLSFMVLLMFLGNTFSSGQRANWIRQLPFSSMSLNLFPLLVIFAYGLTLLFFIPWGAFDSGVSVFAIGIPTAVFLTLKNARNYIIGLFKSAAVGIGLILLWMYLFYDWSALQPTLLVECVALILFTGIWLFLGRRERIYTLTISTALLVLLISTTIYRQARTPQDFSQATLDHSFFPTEKTWSWFKKMALDAKYWDSVDQFNLPSFVRFRSQDFSDRLSDDEKIQFIENIEHNRMKWKDAKLPEYRPMRFASFLQPEIRFANYSRFPVGRNNVTPKIEEYLYKNWKDSRLFCQLLPFRKSVQYLEKLFLVEDCSAELFNQAPWSFYSFTEYGDFEKQFDRYLLEAFEKSPSKTRSNLMSYMSSHWGLYETKDKYDEYRYVVFNQKPLTPELLAEIKRDRSRQSLKNLKEMSGLSQSDFIKQVKDFYLDDKDAKVPMLFLCQYLYNDCNSFLNEKKSHSISLPEAWYRRLNDLTFQGFGMWIIWMKEEIALPENWSKIEKLRDYAKSRNDL